MADLQAFEIANAIEARHSSRLPFDSERRVPDRDLRLILEAARWAPTPHNMQNFEVIVVDDPAVLATMFPPSWRTPDATPEDSIEMPHSFLGHALQGSPTLLIVLHDARKRAPASERDLLGSISLGCVLQNMWLMATGLGISVQVLSALSGGDTEAVLHQILDIPGHMQIAFACRLGYPRAPSSQYPRVRREVADFTHYNRYSHRGR